MVDKYFPSALYISTFPVYARKENFMARKTWNFMFNFSYKIFKNNLRGSMRMAYKVI